jgi:hypothetical protein
MELNNANNEFNNVLDHGVTVLLFSCHVCMDFGMATYVVWCSYNFYSGITTTP